MRSNRSLQSPPYANDMSRLVCSHAAFVSRKVRSRRVCSERAVCGTLSGAAAAAAGVTDDAAVTPPCDDGSSGWRGGRGRERSAVRSARAAGCTSTKRGRSTHMASRP